MLLVACARGPEVTAPKMDAAKPPAVQLDEGDEPIGPDQQVVVLGLGPEDTRAKLTPMCAAGGYEACYRLGSSWHHGLEGTRNVTKARALYRSACDHEVTEACHALERADWMGWGSAADPANIVGELQQLCEAGQASSCQQLGTLLNALHGVGPAQSPVPSPGQEMSVPEILQRACDLGSTQACEQRLVFAHHTDPAFVRRHNRTLCEEEGGAACLAYADACAAGVGGPVDVVAAQKVYDRRCDAPSLPKPPPLLPPPPPLPPGATEVQRMRHQWETRRAAESLQHQPKPETEEDRRQAEEVAVSCDKGAAITAKTDPVASAAFRRVACILRTHRACGAR